MIDDRKTISRGTNDKTPTKHKPEVALPGPTGLVTSLFYAKQAYTRTKTTVVRATIRHLIGREKKIFSRKATGGGPHDD
jgi:hypothetical protein